MSEISITQDRIEELIREHIGAALSEIDFRQIARAELRHQLGVFTLKEACRWLKWKSPLSLSRALKRHGIDVIKTDPKKITLTLPDLIAFREKHRVSRSKKILKVEGTIAA
jgi:hypothetical protein